MSDFEVTEIKRCANSACPNRPHEGRFVLVKTSTNVVGGHRPLLFFMCAPCASSLAGES